VENRITLITFGRGRNKKEAKNKMKKSAIIAIIIILLILASVSAVFAATGWFSTSVPATGTINITTTTPVPDFNYTLSPNVAFGTSNFAAGAPVSVTGTILVTNTGNQPINSLTAAGVGLPTWLTASITQTPVPVGQAVQETVTLAGTAPTTTQTVNLVGGTSTEITITPGS
jgi:hypothetical protein